MTDAPLYASPLLVSIRDVVRSKVDLREFVIVRAIELSLHKEAGGSAVIRALELIERLVTDLDAPANLGGDFDSVLRGLSADELASLDALSFRILEQIRVGNESEAT